MTRTVVVGAAAAVLVWSGEALGAPPPDPGRWAPWVEALGPVTAALSLVRVGALVVAGAVLVAAAVAGGARVVGAVRVAAVAERALPMPLRRAAAGVGVASAVAIGGAPLAAAQGPPPTGEPLVLLPSDGTATMRVLDDDAPPPSPSPAPSAPAPSAPAEDTWTVAPGDSFWSIAADVLADATGRAPSDAEITLYWRALVDANRNRLVSADADLIHPGQVFVLPPP